MLFFFVILRKKHKKTVQLRTVLFIALKSGFFFQIRFKLVMRQGL